jgi:hypothetical protein
MAEKIEVGVVIKGADTASKELNTLDKSADNLGTQFQSMSAAADRFTGGAVTGFKNAAAGTKTFIKGLKLTKVALISTGIGAIVVAVGALVAAFSSTNKNAKKIKVGMAALGAVVERVTGFFRAAGGFITGLFSGGVTKALSNYREEMDKLPGSMQDAIDKAMELERRTQALRTSQRDLSLQFAEGRAQIKEYNMIAEDTTRGLDERLEAAQKAIDIERELMAARQAQAQEEFDIAKERAAQSDTSEEDLDNLAALEVNLINIRTESAEMQTTLNNKLNIIKTQSAAAAEAEADAVKAAEKEKQDAIKETQRIMREGEDKRLESLRDYLMSEEELELKAFQEKADRLLLAEMEAMINGEEVKGNLRQLLQEERDAIEAKHEAQRQAVIDKEQKEDVNNLLHFLSTKSTISEEDAAKKVLLEQATAAAIKAANMGLVQAGFQALQAMAKTEEGQKKLAIAQILVNQGIALSNAIAGAQASALGTGPGAVFTAPGFTATLVGMVLSSFASIKGIMNQAGAATDGLDTTMPSMGGGGGGGDLGNTQLALTPDIAGSFGAGTLELPAVQAYVLQNEIASADALQQELQNRASL